MNPKPKSVLPPNVRPPGVPIPPDGPPRMDNMELRDWFAGMALSGLLSVPQDNYEPRPYMSDAKRAWKIADAMMEFRKS